MISQVPDMHPYKFLKKFALQGKSEVSAFNFSYYRYIPQTLADDRIYFSVKSDDLLEEASIVDLLNSCPAGMELAFHSVVQMNSGQFMHIPMIDMYTNSPAMLGKLKPFWGDELYSHVKWYRSGRSFHGYAGKLIEHADWVSLMGRLLLVNQPNMPPTVDPRWVGHRLVAGYAALRWSCNTPHYLELPKAVL